MNYYEMYQKKYRMLSGTIFEIPSVNFSSIDHFRVLSSGDKPFWFFFESKGRPADRTLFSTPMCFDSDHEMAIKILADYLKNHSAGDILFVVETFLENEFQIIQKVCPVTHHFSLRLLNTDLSRIPDIPANQNVTIRPFRPGLDESLFVKLFNESFTGLCEPTHRDEISRWVQSARFEPMGYLFAEIDENPVAFIAVEIDRDRKSSYLQEIGVIPDFRRKKIASRLIRESFNRLHSSGIDTMGVGVLSDNLNASNLFKKWNFHEFYQRIYKRFRHDLLQNHPRR